MDIDFLQSFLLWCLAFNFAVLLLWVCVFTFARPWIRRMHGRSFPLSDQAFDAIHYGGMALFKLLVLVFNVAPLFALWMLRGAG